MEDVVAITLKSKSEAFELTLDRGTEAARLCRWCSRFTANRRDDHILDVRLAVVIENMVMQRNEWFEAVTTFCLHNRSPIAIEMRLPFHTIQFTGRLSRKPDLEINSVQIELCMIDKP